MNSEASSASFVTILSPYIFHQEFFTKSRIKISSKYPNVYETYDLPGMLMKKVIQRHGLWFRVSLPHIIQEGIGDAYIPFSKAITYISNQSIVLITMKNVVGCSDGSIYFKGSYFIPNDKCHPKYWNWNYQLIPNLSIDCKVFKSVIHVGHQHAADFGHWFLEVFPALMMFPRTILYESNIFIPKREHFIIECLQTIGFNLNNVIYGEYTYFYAINYYTAYYSNCGDLNQALLHRLRKHFVKKYSLDTCQPSRFLIYNRVNMSREITNFPDFFEALRKIYPNITWEVLNKTMTIEESARLMNEVKLVFAIHGSFLCNALFMQKRTVVIELQMEQWLLSFVWLSYYTEKYSVIGRDSRISWHRKQINNLNLTYVMKMFEYAFQKIS